MSPRRVRGRSGGGRAPGSEYRDAEGNVIVLRTSLSGGTRSSYARISSGEGLAPGATREDAWHRAFEFLFERLAQSWTIAGAEALTSQRELLGRLRFASAAERAWLRECMREHCSQFFPDVQAP
jgi:hypothetical protein